MPADPGLEDESVHPGGVAAGFDRIRILDLDDEPVRALVQVESRRDRCPLSRQKLPRGRPLRTILMSSGVSGRRIGIVGVRVVDPEKERAGRVGLEPGEDPGVDLVRGEIPPVRGEQSPRRSRSLRRARISEVRTPRLTNAAVANPFRRNRSASGGRAPRLPGGPGRCCSSRPRAARCEKNIEAWEGSVMGMSACAFSKSVPSAASQSRAGVRAFPGR